MKSQNLFLVESECSVQYIYECKKIYIYMLYIYIYICTVYI